MVIFIQIFIHYRCEIKLFIQFHSIMSTFCCAHRTLQTFHLKDVPYQNIYSFFILGNHEIYLNILEFPPLYMVATLVAHTGHDIRLPLCGKSPMKLALSLCASFCQSVVNFSRNWLIRFF